MRFKSHSLLFIAFAAMLFLASCSKKTNTLGLSVPANAAFVLHINAESMSAKLPWDEIKQNNLFKSLYADTSLGSLAKAALDNPENTGIDIKKDLILFVMKDSTGGYIAVQGTVKDETKFKAYNSAALKNANSSTKDGIQYLVSERMTISWNKDKFVLITDVPEMAEMNNIESMMKRDSSVQVEKPKSTRDGISTAGAVYTLKKDKSLAVNEKFSELAGKKADVHFWVNGEALAETNPGLAGMSMINIRKLYEGSFQAGTVQFENGKIEVDMKSYAGKEMTDLIKKYSGTKINADMVKRLPAKDVAVFLAISFKPEGIKELAKLVGMEGLINMGASSFGVTLDDFVKANKGDILFSVSDINKDSSGKTSAAVVFAASKGDKASFDKLVAAGQKMTKNQLGTEATGIYFNQNDQYYTVGNNKSYIDQFVGKEGSSKFDFFDKISSGPVGGYVNLQYILSKFKTEAGKDSLANVAFDASLKMWDNIIISGGEFKGGGMNQHFEVNLVDRTTNSLKQLNQYAAVIGSVAQQKHKEKDLTGIRLHGDTSGNKDSLLVQ